MSDNPPQWNLDGDLARLRSSGLLRQLRVIESPQGARVEIGQRTLVNFSSNDYLGLAADARLTQAAEGALHQWGWGAGASRLVCGNLMPHADLEARIASFKRTEAAMVFPTGYQANLAAVRSLVGSSDTVFLDKLNHASIIDAAFAGTAAGQGRPRVRVYPHRDYDRLESLLKDAESTGRKLIVSDAVFSMEGDVADLQRLVDLKTRYDAWLCVDEAHATGVFGRSGRGLAEEQGVDGQVDVIVGTLSKAVGSIGGFIAGSRSLIDWLVNTARSFIYTTAIPPAACAASMRGLDIIEQEPGRRDRLRTLAERVRNELRDHGLNISTSSTQIVPVIIGTAQDAVRIAGQLEQAGLWVPAIRPPSVPAGQARLRVSLCATHADAEIDQLISALVDICKPVA
jgi:8-amino-7-oxononanoate synthase